MRQQPDGVIGQAAMRDLVVGKTLKKDRLIDEVVTEGFVAKDNTGRKVRYIITVLG